MHTGASSNFYKEDVLTPLEKFNNEAFSIMLPFYGITKHEDRIRAIKNRVIHGLVQNLQTFDRKKLTQKMEDYDSRMPLERESI